MNLWSLVMLLGTLIFSGCASMNDTMTPSLSVFKDDFDGSTIIRQSPVSSSSSLGESWHTLGFEWSSKTPDTIFITAGTNGITNITDVAFNVDGEVISSIKPASTITEYGSWSTRRFQLPMEYFLKLTNGKNVKMKLTRNNDYTVSSFGTEVSGAIVSSKFPPFIAKLKELRSLAKSK